MLLLYNQSPGIARGENKVAKGQDVMYLEHILQMKKEKYLHDKTIHRLYMNIGFFISILLVVLLFQWKAYDKAEVDLQVSQESLDDLLDIPLTKQPPPPPPKQVIQQPTIVEVANEEEILEEVDVDFDINISVDEVVSEVEYNTAQSPPEEKADEVFLIVENSPEPKMGMAGFMTYLYENINYPNQALRLGVEGKVFVEFIVNADGSLSDFKVVRGIGGGCDEEALRVLRNAEPWNPGKQRGKAVRVRMVLPIHFILKQPNS